MWWRRVGGAGRHQADQPGTLTKAVAQAKAFICLSCPRESRWFLGVGVETGIWGRDSVTLSKLGRAWSHGDPIGNMEGRVGFA